MSRRDRGGGRQHAHPGDRPETAAAIRIDEPGAGSPTLTEPYIRLRLWPEADGGDVDMPRCQSAPIRLVSGI